MGNKTAHIDNENKRIALYRNEAFDNGFYIYFKKRRGNKISTILNSKDRNIKFDTITYRQLNSWGNQHLLSVQREGREWRRFSVIDAVWVKLVKELRDFGMSWEQLRITKQSLEFASEKCGVAMPMLEFYSAFAIGNKLPVLLLIFKDGIAIPCSFTQYKVAKEIIGIDDHIQLSLNNILQGMFPEMDLKTQSQTGIPVTVDEMELLAFLRIGDYEKVEIKYKDGNIDIIEGTERQVMQQVSDIINDKCYEEIKIRKRDDGVITSIVRTKKKKLKNK